jgi:hypothetical protein
VLASIDAARDGEDDAVLGVSLEPQRREVRALARRVGRVIGFILAIARLLGERTFNPI